MGSLFGGSMIGKRVWLLEPDVSGRCSFRGVLSFGFLVDTASEPLPKRFGRQGLGHAKRKSTTKWPRNEFSTEKSEKAKTKGN